MTHILIVGAAGMVGRKLTERLVRDSAADRLTLIDVVTPDAPSGFTGQIHRAALDLSAQGAAAQGGARPGRGLPAGGGPGGVGHHPARLRRRRRSARAVAVSGRGVSPPVRSPRC